jgi:transposase
MSGNDEVNESIRPLLKLSRETVVRSQRLDYALVSSLERDSLLGERLERLRTIPGVGPITALTWALEIGDVSRFQSIKQAISYCGLVARREARRTSSFECPSRSRGTSTFSKCWVEAAKLAPRYNHELALVYERERQRGNKNRATLAVARKMVAYMLAVERRKQDFVLTREFSGTVAA